MSKRKLEEDTLGSEGINPDFKRKNDAMDRIAEQAYTSAEYSDMTIICGNVVFHAHKLIVCPQSEYFKKACSSGFQEATEPIRLPDTEPELMRKVLEYLYTGTYTLDFEKSDGCDTSHAPNKGNTKMVQSDSVSHSASSSGRGQLGPFEESSTKFVSGPDSEPNRLRRESVPTHSQANSSNPGDQIADTWSSARDSDGKFVASCIANPAYFHLRMYAAADYFIIGGLCIIAEAEFYGAFAKNPTQETQEMLEQSIKEIYSDRADYCGLRDIVLRKLMKLIRGPETDNLSLLSSDFLQSVPKFTTDLCLELLTLANRPLLNVSQRASKDKRTGSVRRAPRVANRPLPDVS
ncbi:uncharacterized protein N7458_000454 [Penicillium daleae]|uniref:BTB domain-containing protein n=1 Tax=Penicillium daleae TaxID=63821 RepID=A0AAD6CGK5_9EURO|nr:uncharacterized protein N7458_000454 [Penicillium daleae]KAJ5464768.1 hypothetical protein N7458_000454 [Penicillium daleae]